MPRYKHANQKSEEFKSSDGSEVRCLYITNIPCIIQSRKQFEMSLMNLFKMYGQVVQIYISKTDQIKSNAYAFVTFATPEEALRMFNARSQIRYMKRKLFVSVADSWHQPSVRPDGTLEFPHRQRRNAENQTPPQPETGSDEEEEEEEVEEFVDEQEGAIASLNEDCFLLILSFVPFKERHVLSHVCRRWRMFMQNYWSRITELNFHVEPFKEVEYTDQRLELYLRLCPSITSVHLYKDNVFSCRVSQSAPTSQSIVKTANLCPKLQELTINGLELKGRPFAAIAHSCKHLRAMTIKTCKFDERDNGMNAIVRKCSEFEKLKITNCNLKPGHWLRNLPRGLKYLSLLCCEMYTHSFLEGLTNVKDSLEELELVIDMCSDPLNFVRLHGFQKLHSVTYVNRSVQPQHVSVNMFQNLKCLELEFNTFLTNEIIEGLVKYCPNLIALNIASSKDAKLSATGYKAIANLKDLVKLNISMNNITDEVFEEIADKCSKLEILCAYLCPFVSDVGCKKVVQKLMHLRELHVDNCSEVSIKTLDAAIDAAIQFPDKAKLTIHASGTGIKETQRKVHPLVELSLVNRRDLNWMLCSSLQDFTDFFLDDDFTDDDDDDDDDYDIDIYDEDEIYNYPYDSDEEFDFNIDELNPFNLYLNFL